MKVVKGREIYFERLICFTMGFVSSLSLLILLRFSEHETRLYRTNPNKEMLLPTAEHPLNFIHKRSIRIPSKNSTVPESWVNTRSIQNTRRFSHFRCSGDDKSLSSFKTRICVFENTCYNSLTNNVEYYIRPDSPQV
jgi:DNA mismatch repair ATPase MutS